MVVEEEEPILELEFALLAAFIEFIGSLHIIFRIRP